MPISNAARAERIWAKIQRKPSSVVFTKPATNDGAGNVTPAATLAAQTVRATSDNRASLVAGLAGAAPQRHLVVFGIKDHATLADTDINEGYTFTYDGDTYRVVDTVAVPGGVQAIARMGQT
jgi:hypothetical protein